MSELLYTKWFKSGLRPPPKLTVSEWSDQHRILSSKSASEPGYWRTNRTPYLREIMDSLSATSRVQEVVFMKSSQIGGTEAGNNWVGYIIHHAPGPILLVQPTVEMAKRNSKQRIDTLIEDSPVLSKLVRDPKSRDAGNTMLMKEFTGGVLVMTGANSAVGLRSLPARYIFLDEVDAYPDDISEEGDPIKLALARTRTFADKRKVFIVSTPTIHGRSKIERSLLETDYRKYFVPCPLCTKFQTFEWSNIKWKKEDSRQVWYECEHCQGQIFEHQKTKMLELGEWRSTIKENESPTRRGYHLNSLYSPVGWLSWQECVKEFLEAHKNPMRLRSFINTILGECWQDKGEAPDWKRLYERREKYALGSVPDSVCFLTCGIDVQKDRLEAHVVGWGKGKEAWSIDYRIFMGDTSDISTQGPWQKIKDLLQETFKKENGLELPIRMACVDSGFNTQVVYSFVRQYPMSRVVATKGDDRSQALINAPRSVEVKTSGKTMRGGLKVWLLGVSIAKNELYGLLRLEKPTDTELEAHGYPPGFIHFPEYGEEFFKQLTAEQLMKRVVKGFTKFEWAKVYERNEALDTFILARCAAAIIGMDRFTEDHWDSMRTYDAVIREKTDTNVSKTNTNVPQMNTNPGQRPVERRKSNFW